MPKFICPFNGSFCSQSCQFWIQERGFEGNFLNGFIPIGISLDDIIEYIAPKLKGKKYLEYIPFILTRFSNGNNYDDSGPAGRCLRLEKSVDISKSRGYENT